MQKTFRNAITVLKLDFLEMKCLPQSQKQTGALSPGGTQPRTVPSPLTHRQGRMCPATDRVKVWGLYFDLLGVRFQPATEISPADEMDSFDFKL